MSRISKPDLSLDDSYREAMVNRPHRGRVQLMFTGDPGRTEQSHKFDCDITNILNRFSRSGGLPPMPQFEFADLVSVADYQTALNAAIEVKESFMSLPSKIRSEFNNDPAALLAAFEDDSKRPLLESLGLVKAKPVASVESSPSPKGEPTK